VALDTFNSIVGRVQLHCPAAGLVLARDWVNNAFRRIAERRRWSWLIKQNQFVFPAAYTTGTVTVTNASATVTGSGTAWDSTMIGLQFRLGVATPIYTISDVPDATTLTLEQVWGPATASAQTYKIYKAYLTPQTDFQSFISVWDFTQNWQLWLNVDQMLLNTADAQRSNVGNAYVVAWRQWNTTAVGVLGANQPMYEFWPHVQQAAVYPYLYEARCGELVDGDTLPRYIRGDVLMEMALSQAARWPGTDTEKNPYYDINLSRSLESRTEKMIEQMEVNDDNTFLQDATYQMPRCPWPFGGPFPMDAAWLQSHAI